MQAISLRNSFTKGATSVVHKLEHQRRRHSSYTEDAKLDEKDDNESKGVALEKEKKNAATPDTPAATSDGSTQMSKIRSSLAGSRQRSFKMKLMSSLTSSFTTRNNSKGSHTSSETSGTTDPDHSNSFSSTSVNQIDGLPQAHKEDSHNKAKAASSDRREAFRRQQKSFSCKQLSSSPPPTQHKQRRRSSSRSSSRRSLVLGNLPEQSSSQSPASSKNNTDPQASPCPATALDSNPLHAKRRDFMLAKRKALLTNVVASVHAKKYINECLFGDVDGNATESVLDRDKWESIPQYSRSDMIVRQHLGKGSFSDVFEVHVLVTVDAIKAPTLKELGSSATRKLSPSSKMKEARRASLEEDEDGDHHVRISSEAAKEDTEEDLPTPTNRRRQSTKRSISLRHASSGIMSSITEGTTDTEDELEDSNNQARNKRIPNRRQALLNKNSGISASFCLRKSGIQKRQTTYAMKCLRPQIRSNSEQFIIGVEDLVHETAMLVSLDHPNIIKIHGRAGKECLSNSFCLSDGYFILLDRLQDTLQDRIVDWKNEKRQNISKGSSSSRSSISMSQLETAYSIADAVSYLHSKHIMFRDLKPANVGYDSQNQLKLFDFGFAIGVSSSSNQDSKGQPLDEWCGTPRYMAPEVAMETGYGIPADVHSYGIVFWEILSLKKPFANIPTSDQLHQSVFVDGARPKVSKSWPKALKSSMTSCWEEAPEERPTMEFMKSVLSAHIQEVKTAAERRNSGATLSSLLPSSGEAGTLSSIAASVGSK